MTPDYEGYNWTLNAIEMWQQDRNNARFNINDGTRCRVEIISANSGGNSTEAIAVAEWLIEQGVVAIVGLEDSSLAIPVGEVANYSETPMIATTATHPNVTLNRSYVFRTGFVNKDQARVLVKLGTDIYAATTASVLFQEDLAYSADLANVIKKYWERNHGGDSVLSFVSFNSTNVNASDYVDSITSILDTDADVLFVPILSQQVPDVVKAIRQAGWESPILGGDGWMDLEALKNCSDACVNSFFTANYLADGPTSNNFVEEYTQKYGVAPNDMAALAYDAVGLIKVALKDYGEWSCNIFTNREGLRDALENVEDFNGVAGDITFGKNNNPKDKCVYIANVNASYYPSYFYSFCPSY